MTVDEAMVLVRKLADTQVEHAKAVAEFANNQADYGRVQALAEQWVEAEKNVRNALRALTTGETA
jgi:hypothetical protein